MKQRGTAQDKWGQTGWRIEQRYGNKVLIGNWAEERLQIQKHNATPVAACQGFCSTSVGSQIYSEVIRQPQFSYLSTASWWEKPELETNCIDFTREPQTANSTNRVDHRPHWDSKPDVFERRSALLRAEGLPSKLLFAHDDPPSSHYWVTQYEESYRQKHTDALPTVRPWHPDSLTALPTNSGPLQPTKQRLEKQQSHLPSLTVYRSAYQRHPLGAFCQRRSARAPRVLSSHLHAANHNNKDLDLRRRSLLQIPDHCLSQHPQSQHCASHAAR